jgi:hypothetical protein
MYNIFLILTIATIISQAVHMWFCFISFSRLKGWLKLFQAIMFCSILSIAILAFVLIEKPILALFGAFIEIVVNTYYYNLSYFEGGLKARIHKRESILRYWRKNWLGLFFGLLLPMLIYVFAVEMVKLK